MIETIKRETLEEIRSYLEGQKDVDARNTYIGLRQYSLRELLQQVEDGTPDGVQFAVIWENGKERSTARADLYA